MWGLDFHTLFLLLIIGFLGGLLSGSMGVGGGVIMVPMLVFFLGMTQHQAQGTFLAMMIPPLAAFSAYNYWRAGHVNWKYAVILMFTFALGSFLGSWLSNAYLSDKTLRQIFGIIMILAALKMIFSK
jgi:uncharacterized membrane protein YfcA